MIEYTQNRQFLLCKWPQYHFSRVFMIIYINICSLIVFQMNIYWDTEILTSWNVKMTLKMIENAQNRSFLLCKWPQYHFSMVFMMVYINICSLLVCQMNIYWDRTHIDVIDWSQFNVENDRKWSKIRKIVNFCCVNGHNTTFQWFLWWFILIFAVW